MSKVWDYKSNSEDKLSKQVEKDRDIVMTNPEMAKHLINTITFHKGDIVMEPCRGKGAFYNNLPDDIEKVWCEVNEGRNYFDFDGIVDITLSNPPFVPRKLFWGFMLKSMDTTRKEIYWLINISAMNVFTPKRLNIMKDKGWYIQSQYIVADKRWYGRYAWVKISKEPSNFFGWCDETF